MRRDHDVDALADLARNEHEQREELRKRKRDLRGRKQRVEHTKTKREHRAGSGRAPFLDPEVMAKSLES